MHSTTLIDTLSPSQASKEATTNELLDATSPGMVYGRHTSACAALTWAYYGGAITISGTPTLIANGTISLTASNTNYLEINNSTGAVVKNTSGWTGTGYTPLYKIVAGTSTVTSYEDYRTFVHL